MAIRHQIAVPTGTSLTGRVVLPTTGVPSERQLVVNALGKVATCINRAKLWLGQNKRADSETKALVRKWFGNDRVEICTWLQARYKAMASVYSRDVKVWRFNGNTSETADFYAQVFDEAGSQTSNRSVNIEFADEFFATQSTTDQQRTRLSDAQVRTGTIIHETSHRIWVVQGSGTSAMLSDDFAYDYNACRKLARHKAHYARANADSIMYFALEFYSTASPTVSSSIISRCVYKRRPLSAGLPSGDMDELNNNTAVHVDRKGGD